MGNGGRKGFGREQEQDDQEDYATKTGNGRRKGYQKGAGQQKLDGQEELRHDISAHWDLLRQGVKWGVGRGDKRRWRRIRGRFPQTVPEKLAVRGPWTPAVQGSLALY